MPHFVSTYELFYLLNNDPVADVEPQFLQLDFAANEGVVLVIQLEPARLGSLSYYLPILLLDEEEEEGFEQQQVQETE
jgi:hypothetical protein